MSRGIFRPYSSADRESCLAIFDANCPAFFAPNERADFLSFLDAAPIGYEVCEVAGRVVAAFGLLRDDRNARRLSWIMIDPDSKGSGLGSAIVQRVVSQGKNSRATKIRIAASHKSAPFFARFGAKAVAHVDNGWGPGMDRIDMELLL